MPNKPLSREAGYNLGRLILLGMFVQVLVIGYTFYDSHQGRVNLVNTQRKGCERSKLDRQDNADFQVAYTKYVNTLKAAGEVPKEVRAAAKEANKTYQRTAQSLTERSKINCKEVYPDVKFIP
jgi:hypothetical protein